MVMALGCSVSSVAMDFTYDNNGIRCLWDDADRMGFMTATGLQIRFGITAIASDGHCATATGYGWSLKNDLQYYVYAPYRTEYSLNENVASMLPVSYLQQRQKGNDNTDHLADYAFLAGRAYVSSTMPIANADLYPMTSVVRIAEKFSKATTITQVELSVGTPLLPTGGYMNLVENCFEPTDFATAITLTTDNLSVGEGEEAVVYFTLPPCTLSGGKMTITFIDVNGKKYVKDLDAFDVDQGCTYCIGSTNTPSEPATYAPATNGTAKAPVVILNDMPVRKSYVATSINDIHHGASSERYDLLGRRCAPSYKGIEIINGKKIAR